MASGGVTVEAGGGQSTPQPNVQPAPFEYQKLTGVYEPTETLSLDASVRLQHDLESSPTPGTTLRSNEDRIWAGAFNANLDLGKHLALGAELSGAVPSSRQIASQFSSNSNALMVAKNSNLGASADLVYDTFDENAAARALDVSLDLSLGYTRYWNTQSLAELDTRAGPQTASSYLATCASASTTPSCEVASRAAGSSSASLGQARVGASVTGTIAERTDVTLDGAYYAYGQANPDQVGFFTYRAPGTSQKDVYGAGLPLIPPRWSVRPELAHRWKTLSARIWYQFSDYTLADYVGHAVGGKVELKLGDWRVYASGSYRADVSPGGTETSAHSWTGGVGLTRKF